MVDGKVDGERAAPRGLHPLLPIFLTVFVDVLGITIVLPLLPFYAEHFGATPLVATTLTASYAVCQLVSGPLLGRASDRMGRKPILLLSQAGTFAAFLMLANASSLWMLFAGRMIDGATAGNLTIAQAYISDVTKPENRTKAFGLIGIAFGAGFVLGPALSGVLAHRFGFQAPFWAAACLSFLSIVFTTTLLPNVKPALAGEDRGSAWKRMIAQPLPRRRLLEFLAFSLSFSSLMGGLALFLERQMHYGTREVGLVYTFAGVTGGFLQGALGKLVKRFGESNLARAGFLAMVVGYGLLGLAHSLWLLLVLAGVASLGSSLVRPCITTLLTRSVPKTDQGAILGASQSLSSIAMIAAPPTVGFFIGRGWLEAFGFAAGAYAAAGFFLSFSPPPPSRIVDDARPASGSGAASNEPEPRGAAE